MNCRLPELRAKTAKLTASPGVYLMKNQKNEIIYIGKAKNLKNRVTSYFRESADHTPKVASIAKVSAAIDIEQFDLADQRAGLADGLLDLAAGYSLATDQSQIALDRCIGAEGLIAQLALYAGHQSLIVQLAQIDVLAVLLLLGDLQLGVDLVGQLAEHAQTLTVAVHGGADAGVQPCGGLALIIKGQAKTCCQRFQRALDGEEVLPAF